MTEALLFNYPSAALSVRTFETFCGRSISGSRWKSEARQHKNSENVPANKEEHFPAQSLFILTFSDYKGLSMRMEVHK